MSHLVRRASPKLRTPIDTCVGRESDVSTEQERGGAGPLTATCGEFSIAEFTAQLGYPNSGTMSRWIKADPPHDRHRAQYPQADRPEAQGAIGRIADGESISAAARPSA